MSSLRVLAALVALSLALAATVGPSSAATEPADAVPGITLVEQRVIEIPGSRLVSLSPDGGSIAVTRPAGADVTQLCIHDVATLAERVCADVSELDSGLWHDSVVWSPDSEWLAFAELWPQYFAGGGLWLVDASTGALTNLLDDSALALYPTFTPDSTAVTFERTLFEAGEFGSVDIATVPITGGEAVRLGDSDRAGSNEGTRMLWSEDGSGLYTSLVDRQGSDSGIWVFEADGKHARQLLSVAGPDDLPPSIIAVSPRGEHLLLRLPNTYRGAVDCCALVDGVSGAVESIESLRPKARRSSPIIGAMLSPDGSQLLTVSGGFPRRQVAVRDVAGSDETILMNERRAAPWPTSGTVATWAQNDTVLVTGGRGGGGIMLVLERRDQSGT
jgi:hypothetical protein